MKMALFQYGCQVGATQSGSQYVEVKSVNLYGTKLICVIIKSIANQSRAFIYLLRHLHINQGHMNINYVIGISIR